MRYSLALAGMAAMAAAQSLDFDAVNAAPAPIATGPAVTAAVESIVYSPAASGSAAVTGVASASATASQTVNLKARGEAGLQARTWCYFFGVPYICPAVATTSAKATSTKATSAAATSTAKPTTATSTSSKAAATSSSAATSTFSYNSAIPTPTGIPTTCANTWTNTNAFTSAAGCPTPFEVGTYCGFVNPEDPCSTQPDGYGPVASPDTVEAFLAYPAFHSSAKSAKTPSGYAQTFVDLNAATSANTYLGLQTLKSYDVDTCANYCNNAATCTSFNVFFERDPSLNPSAEYCCPNPASITNYKCTLWGSTIDNTTATNDGQYRDGFHVVITGSNGYTKANTTTPVTPPGWTNPQKCGGAHSHPSTCIGNHFFPGPYDPQLCASYASAQNLKNGVSTGRGYSSNTCNFFNAYMLKKDNKPLGTYCSLFAQQYQPTYASYLPGWQSSHFWDVETSWSYCSA